jgi:hypothetical protein
LTLEPPLGCEDLDAVVTGVGDVDAAVIADGDSSGLVEFSLSASKPTPVAERNSPSIEDRDPVSQSLADVDGTVGRDRDGARFVERLDETGRAV